MEKICFLSGPLQGATAELIGDEITIGRAADNAICLDDESISDYHAVISHRSGDWIVKDLRSAGGTLVRGDRVLVSPLQDGDKVVFGTVEAEFKGAAAKLQMPTTPSAPAEPQVVTWPQYRGPVKRPKTSAFKSVILTGVQLAMVAGILAGGYYGYQKYYRAELAGDAPSESPKAAPRVTTSYASQPAALPPAYTPSAAPIKTEAPPAAVPATQGSPVAATPLSKASSSAASPVIQQARLLLAQNKYADTVSYLDKVIAAARDPAVIVEVQVPLKQALDAQLAALLSSKQQWEAQNKILEERLKAAQEKLAQDNRVLEQKKTEEARVYATSGGYWFNGRWIYNTRKGTGDSSAIQSAKIAVMADTQEVKKQTDLLGRYQMQVAALERQIAPIQLRITQMTTVVNASPAK